MPRACSGVGQRGAQASGWIDTASTESRNRNRPRAPKMIHFTFCNCGKNARKDDVISVNNKQLRRFGNSYLQLGSPRNKYGGIRQSSASTLAPRKWLNRAPAPLEHGYSLWMPSEQGAARRKTFMESPALARITRNFRRRAGGVVGQATYLSKTPPARCFRRSPRRQRGLRCFGPPSNRSPIVF